MTSLINGKPIRIKCCDTALIEFPHLLFGKEEATGRFYFDATAYIQLTNPKLPLDDFFTLYHPMIDAIVKDEQVDHIYRINHDNHILIDSSFAVLFIFFTHPPFISYMCNRMADLFDRGFAISDRALYIEAQQRFDSETRQALQEDENTAEPRQL